MRTHVPIAEPDRVKAVEKLNTELTLSEISKQRRVSEAADDEKYGWVCKRVRECFEKMQKENVFPRKCEENLKDLSACLRQVFIGKETERMFQGRFYFEEAKIRIRRGINAARAEYSKSVDDGDMKRSFNPWRFHFAFQPLADEIKIGRFPKARWTMRNGSYHEPMLGSGVYYVQAILRKADALKELKRFDDAFEVYFVLTGLPGDTNIAKELNECVEKSQTKVGKRF